MMNELPCGHPGSALRCAGCGALVEATETCYGCQCSAVECVVCAADLARPDGDWRSVVYNALPSELVETGLFSERIASCVEGKGHGPRPESLRRVIDALKSGDADKTVVAMTVAMPEIREAICYKLRNMHRERT